MSVDSCIADLRSLGCTVTETRSDGWSGYIRGTPYDDGRVLSDLRYVTVVVPPGSSRTPTKADTGADSREAYLAILRESDGLALALVPGTAIAAAVGTLRDACRAEDATLRVEHVDGRCIEQHLGRTAREREQLVEARRIAWLGSRRAE